MKSKLNYHGRIVSNTIIYTAFLIIVFQLSFAQKIKFYADKKAIQYGDSVKISWNIAKIKKKTEILLSERNKSNIIATNLGQNGEFIFAPTVNTIYILQKKNENRKETRSIRINVHKPVIKLFVVKDSINEGEIATVEWFTSFAKYVYLNINNDSLPPSGRYNFRCDSTLNIELRAVNNHGYETSMKKTIVAKPSEYLKADTILCRGQSTLLSWSFPCSKEVILRNTVEKISSKGEIKIQPQHNTRYIFEKYDEFGNCSEKNIYIRVLPPGTFNLSAPEEIYIGEKVDISWTFKYNDTVSIVNLKKHVPATGRIIIEPINDTVLIFAFKYNNEILKIAKNIKIVEKQLVTDIRSVKMLLNGEKISFEIFGVDRSKYPDSVKLYVMASDSKGHFLKDVANMKEYNGNKYIRQIIEQYEGQKYPVKDYTIREISSENDSYNISFVLDYSGSMYGDINFLEKACTGIINKKYPNDAFSVVKFDRKIVPVCPLIKSKELLIENFNKFKYSEFGGSTALYAGVCKGLDLLNDSTLGNKTSNKLLVSFTDGYENASGYFSGLMPCTANELVNIARKTGSRVNFISYRGGTNKKMLDFLSWLTDGKHYNIRKQDQVSKVFDEINLINHHYYEITYKPIAGDGLREVSLVYNDNSGNEVSTFRNIQIGENYDAEKFDYETNTSTPKMAQINDTIKSVVKGNVFTTPQIVALFDFNKSEIQPEYGDNIKKIAVILKNNPLYKIVILGHTDLSGSQKHCMNLSEHRAEAVAKILSRYGIPENRYKCLGLGRNVPVWDVELNDEMSHENRRVEIVMVK